KLSKKGLENVCFQKKIIIITLLLVIFSTLVSAATLKGTIYNEKLDVENDVLVEINGQKYLAKEGTYQFELTSGEYTLTAQKGLIIVTEEVSLGEGEVVFDLFLLPSFVDEDELWSDTDEQLFTEVEEVKDRTWAYYVAALVVIFGLWRIIKARRKWGSLSKFRKMHKAEGKKTVEQHKEEIAAEPGYIDEVVAIIKKNDGRITQKKLRREMLHLSEAKVSLILTELEHKGMIEKVKKGRGNVVLLK
ncbi:MAG: hypothetical protein KKH52_04245, partial [Nanoarchaeota archaeon]|nr:hypothetical protein [Nanoarchaeota archaeon]